MSIIFFKLNNIKIIIIIIIIISKSCITLLQFNFNIITILNRYLLQIKINNRIILFIESKIYIIIHKFLQCIILNNTKKITIIIITIMMIIIIILHNQLKYAVKTNKTS